MISEERKRALRELGYTEADIQEKELFEDASLEEVVAVTRQRFKANQQEER